MNIYTEEYEIATTLLADLFWGPQKNKHAIEDKLVALNLAIEKKNKRKGLRKDKDEGKIDINYFQNVTSQLELCCHLPNKLHGFRTCQKHMKLELRQRQYPEEWNLKESDFLEFINAVASGKMDLEEEISPLRIQEVGQGVEGVGLENKQEVPDVQSSRLVDSLALAQEVEEEIEKEYGIPVKEGAIEAWTFDEDDLRSIIVLYEHAGSTIARFESLGGRQLEEETVAYIQDFSRARSQTEWTRSQIRGYGLVAWKVEEQYQNDPTAILRPAYGACYPETYISVFWDDNKWTWESREGLRFIMTGCLRADLLIYKRATRFEACYRQKMTGIFPEYPMALPMQNPYTGLKPHNTRNLIDRDGDEEDEYDDDGEEDEEDDDEYDDDDEEDEEDDDDDDDGDEEDHDEDIDGYDDRGEYTENGNSRDIHPDLSVLRGLEVSYDGLVYDEFNELVGHLVEGDSEHLAGAVINEYGEVLDAEGFVVGRVETSLQANITPRAQVQKPPHTKQVQFLLENAQVVPRSGQQDRELRKTRSTSKTNGRSVLKKANGSRQF